MYAWRTRSSARCSHKTSRYLQVCKVYLASSPAIWANSQPDVDQLRALPHSFLVVHKQEQKSEHYYRSTYWPWGEKKSLARLLPLTWCNFSTGKSPAPLEEAVSRANLSWAWLYLFSISQPFPQDQAPSPPERWRSVPYKPVSAGEDQTWQPPNPKCTSPCC